VAVVVQVEEASNQRATMVGAAVALQQVATVTSLVLRLVEVLVKQYLSLTMLQVIHLLILLFLDEEHKVVLAEW
jgi:glycerol-3-phosphate acyltransferase PlsY